MRFKIERNGGKLIVNALSPQELADQLVDGDTVVDSYLLVFGAVEPFSLPFNGMLTFTNCNCYNMVLDRSITLMTPSATIKTYPAHAPAAGWVFVDSVYGHYKLGEIMDAEDAEWQLERETDVIGASILGMNKLGENAKFKKKLSPKLRASIGWKEVERLFGAKWDQSTLPTGWVEEVA